MAFHFILLAKKYVYLQLEVTFEVTAGTLIFSVILKYISLII